MKTGIKFIIVIVLIAASFFILLHLGYKASSWTFWLAFIFLPVAGYLIAKTDFRSNE